MFKITVTEIKSEDKETRGDYGIIREEFITAEEYSDLPFEKKKAWEKQEDGQYRRNVYDYRPTTTKQLDTKEIIYEQTLTELDLKTLVKTINQ